MNKVEVVGKVHSMIRKDSGVLSGVLLNYYVVPTLVFRDNTSSKSSEVYEDLIDIIIIDKEDEVMELQEGDYITITEGQFVNTVSSNFNIDVSLLVEMDHVKVIDESASKELSSAISVVGRVTNVFTTKENYTNFYNCIIESGRTTMRVVAWGSLADFMMDSLEIDSQVKVSGFINSVLHKDGEESTTEILAAHVSIIEDLGGTFD